MKMRWSDLGGVCALVFAAACGTEIAVEQPDAVGPDGKVAANRKPDTIVGGTDADITDFPWQVSLQSQSFGHFCGGSVVHENWVITAAHCVVGGRSFFVRAGVTESADTEGQDRDVEAVLVYPGYNGSAPDGGDLALVKVSEPFVLQGPTVQKIAVLTEAQASAGLTNAGIVSVVTGWGTLSEGGDSSPILQQVAVPIVSNEETSQLYGRDISDDQIAAGVVGIGGKDACQGDSGGPLVVRDESGVYTLAGATSWGRGCARPNYPGLYARVSAFESWIVENAPEIGGGEPLPPPEGDEITETFAGELAQAGEDRFAVFEVVPRSIFTATMTGTGDADLYVRFGDEPTASEFDCRPYLNGSDETCRIPVPSDTTTAHVMVRGYSASTYELTVRYLTPSDGEEPPPEEGGEVTESFEDAVARREVKSYGPFSVVSGTAVNAVMTGSGDPDLYLRFGAPPTTSNYDCRPYRSGATETCSLTVPDGTTEAYFMVRGYSAGTYAVDLTYTKP